MEQQKGVAETSEFISVELSQVEELHKTYTPLPFQLDENVKKFQFPTNRLLKSPLPVLSWADHEEVWRIMLQKECMYLQAANILHKHPSLQARMRSILLHWLMEVCEVYKLHRETFYLAVDFVDRYLSQQENIPKQRLQLIGITALFIASKIEEISPPRLMEFAYVTDGTSTEDQILTQELLILKALKWDMSPITVNSWLNIFMQLTNIKINKDTKEKFVFPQYSGYVFSQIAQLLDLVIMDIGSLQFRHNLVAAAAIHHMVSEELALSVSGLKHEDIAKCIEWMTPFAAVLEEDDTIIAKHIPDIPDDDQHNIQFPSVDLLMLDAAHAKQKETRALKEKAGAMTPMQNLLEKSESAPAGSLKPYLKGNHFSIS